MYKVTCLEYTKYDNDIATRPIAEVLNNIDLSGTNVRYDQCVIGCNREPVNTNIRLKLPFTIPVITYDSCAANELVSLLNRHLVTNEHFVDIVEQRVLWHETYMHYVRIRPPRIIKPITPLKVVQTKKPAKRKQYLLALKSLQKQPLRESDTRIKMFIKNERMTMTTPMKAPRAIQSRSPRYNICYQRYIIPYGELWKTKDLIKRTCTKGLNQYEIAEMFYLKWNKYGNPVADLWDHRFFDAKEHTRALMFQNLYINSCFNSNSYWLLLPPRVLNKCHTRNNIKYRVKGTRASGEADTSDGNSTVNDMMISYVYRKIEHDKGLLGDDSVVIHEAKTTINVNDMMEYGFQSKYNQVTEFEDIEYCQCHPIHTINGWLMVREPSRVISRGTTCINHSIKSVDMFKRWCKGVGDCEYSCNAGVPVLQAFAEFMRRSTTEKPIYDREIQEHRIKGDYSHVINDTARISFNKAFGITIKQQYELEHYFNMLKWDLQLVVVDQPTEPTNVIFHS